MNLVIFLELDRLNLASGYLPIVSAQPRMPSPLP